MIEALVGRGDQVFAFAIDYNQQSRKEVEEIGAVPVDYCFSRSGLNPLKEMVNMYRLSRTLRKIAPELVFSYFSKPVIYGTFAAVLAGVGRRVGMLEGLGYLFTDQITGPSVLVRFIKMIQVILYKFSIPFLEKIIFLNSDDKRDLLDRYEISPKSSAVLGGIGVDLNLYPYSKPEISPVSFIFIGRLLVEKGIKEYISAAKLVKSRHPQALFFLVGGSDEANPGCLSQEELEDLQNSNVLIYPGNVSDVRCWIMKAGVFVLPSYREGVPRSTQEAMAMGRPIITTDVPGCRDTVVDGKNGFLVPPWSASALAEKMVYFIENPDAIEVMGAASRVMAEEKYDIKKVNNALLKFL